MSILGCTWWLTHKVANDQIVVEGGSVKSAHTAQDIDSSILLALSAERQLLSASATACLCGLPVVVGQILYGLCTFALFISKPVLANTINSLQFQVLNLKRVKIQTRDLRQISAQRLILHPRVHTRIVKVFRAASLGQVPNVSIACEHLVQKIGIGEPVDVGNAPLLVDDGAGVDGDLQEEGLLGVDREDGGDVLAVDDRVALLPG